MRSSRDGPMTFDAALSLTLPIIAALAAAHRAGITHRDIKPGNVMVTPQGARQGARLWSGEAWTGQSRGARSHDDQATSRTVTTPGLVMGTVDYMSPEQALGEPVDQRTDLFAVGVLLYQLATGVLPFRRPNVTATLDAILHAGAGASVIGAIGPDAGVRSRRGPCAGEVARGALPVGR